MRCDLTLFVCLSLLSLIQTKKIRLVSKYMEGKTALVIGGSYSALPIVRELVEKGLQVLLLTGDKSEPCSSYSKVLINVDYSDFEASKKSLEGLQFDFVVPSCNDTSYVLAAEIARERKLPGFDMETSVSIVNSKSKFRDFCVENSLPSPRQVKVPLPAGEQLFPLLVKPNKSFSGRGISIVISETDFNSAIEIASAVSEDGGYAVEEFVEGTLHSVSSFISDHSVENAFFVDEFCRIYPYQVDNSNHPSILNNSIRRRVVREVERIASLLNLVDGLFHMQFIVNAEDFYFIESMRRCPGDLYGNLVEYSTGFNYYQAYVEGFLGLKFEANSECLPNPRPIARFTESSSIDRIFGSFTIGDEIYRFFPLVKPGDVIKSAPYGKSSIGFIHYPSLKTLFESLGNHDRFLRVNVLWRD